MAQEFLIGRSPSSPVKVPADRTSVSGAHVKITIHDNGEWELEDLNNVNGTYLKDDNGNFQRVYKKRINENSIIRLGGENYSSFVFMAHKALGQEDGYNYEFGRLKKQLKEQQNLEDEFEKRSARNMKIIKLASPLSMVLCVIAQYIIPGLKNDSELNLWVTRIVMAAAPYALGFFFNNDRNVLKALKLRRQKVLTCPRCQQPLSEFDIQNMQCSRCKAK